VKKILFAMMPTMFAMLAMLTMPAMLTAGTAAAREEIPEFEVFGGYSMLKLGASNEDIRVFQDGLYDVDVAWNNKNTPFFLNRGATGSIAYNLNEYFSVVTDVRYNQGELMNGSFEFEVPIIDTSVKVQAPFVMGVKNVSALAGPRFSYRNLLNGRATVFFHALAGLDYWRLNNDYTVAGEILSDKTDKFSPGVAVGGGFDVTVNEKIAVRVIQADYYTTRQMERRMNNVNLSFGIVFRIGEKVLR